MEAQQPPYEPSDETPDDAYQGGHYYPMMAGARYNILGYYPCYKPTMIPIPSSRSPFF